MQQKGGKVEIDDLAALCLFTVLTEREQHDIIEFLETRVSRWRRNTILSNFSYLERLRGAEIHDIIEFLVTCGSFVCINWQGPMLKYGYEYEYFIEEVNL